MIGTEYFVTNYYYDDTNPLHPYSYSLPANAGELPPLNALRDAPESIHGLWPIEDNGKWGYVEDHRETEYWLTEDTQYTPARIMKELGPLPEGAKRTKPTPTEEEILEDKVRTIDAQLLELDNKSVRAIRAVLADQGTSEDEEVLTALEFQAEELRQARVDLLTIPVVEETEELNTVVEYEGSEVQNE